MPRPHRPGHLVDGRPAILVNDLDQARTGLFIDGRHALHQLGRNARHTLIRSSPGESPGLFEHFEQLPLAAPDSPGLSVSGVISAE